MAVNNITDLLVRNYSQSFVGLTPTTKFETDIHLHLLNELQKLEETVKSLSEASIQSTDQAPSKPKRGMVRFNVLPWNPLSNNSLGLVVYNGTAWVAV